MDVKMTRTSASPTATLEVGKTYTLEAGFAMALIEAGAAVAVNESKSVRQTGGRVEKSTAKPQRD